MSRRDSWYKRPIGVLFETEEGRRIDGQLRLKRGGLFDSNVVGLVDDAFFNVADGSSLHGISEAGRVSLIDCVQGGMLSQSLWGDFELHHGDVSFRYALFGNQHITKDDECIRRIQFTLEGAESSVFMHDRSDKFGHLLDPDQEILDAIVRNRPDNPKGEFVKGKAMVSYFTGDWYFLPQFTTVLGTVYVERLMRMDNIGRSMKDTPRVTVDFDDEPTTLEGAWEKMREIRQFFAWMMGYSPGWKDVQVFASSVDEEGNRADLDCCLDAFGPNEWKQVPGNTWQFGTLIDASRYPNHFMEVMGKWLQRNKSGEKKSANARFFSSIRGVSDRFVEDSIVSAANTFDLLPNQEKPKVQPLPDNVIATLNCAKEKIKCQMYSGEQREDVLTALGQIRTNRRLRAIVEHRAEIVLEHFGADTLKNLKRVIKMAVECRNHYTHGPRNRISNNIDYTDIKVVLFLSNTLEFIFAASELLHCGWDSKKSVGSEWHPIGGYVKTYNSRCSTVLGLR